MDISPPAGFKIQNPPTATKQPGSGSDPAKFTLNFLLSIKNYLIISFGNTVCPRSLDHFLLSVYNVYHENWTWLLGHTVDTEKKVR